MEVVFTKKADATVQRGKLARLPAPGNDVGGLALRIPGEDQKHRFGWPAGTEASELEPPSDGDHVVSPQRVRAVQGVDGDAVGLAERIKITLVQITVLVKLHEEFEGRVAQHGRADGHERAPVLVRAARNASKSSRRIRRVRPTLIEGKSPDAKSL
jgi:hypothetical protein